MVKRSRFPVWPWLLMAGLVGASGLVGCSVIGATLGGADSGPKVGVIDLSGAISDSGSRSLLSGSSGGARDFIADVEEARRDKNVRSVVIRINSPGGSASASQEMFQAVQRLRKVKPVICSMGDVAASGGYYVASGCDKIYANGATTTGSIGVISSSVNVYGLISRYGVQDDTVKSARLKGGTNPLAPIDPLDRALRKKQIENIYAQFVADVVTGRAKATKGKLTKAKLLPLANGTTYTGQQAKANGLIDELGGLHDAIREAAKRGGITDTEPPVKNVSDGLSPFSVESGGEMQSIARAFGDALGKSAGEAFARGAMNEAKTEARGGDRLVVQAR